MTTRALGRRPADPARPVLRMDRHFTAAAFTPPAGIDYARAVPSWVLGANTRFGTCGPTSAANLILLVSTVLGGSPVKFTDAEVFDLYQRSGCPNFDPSLPPGDPRQQDDGVIMTVLLSELVRGGIGFGDRNVKALAFGSINPRNPTALWAAGALFGGVLWGADLDVAQAEQTDAGRPWAYTPGSASWGGHAVLAAPRYTDAPGEVADRTALVSWAQVLDSTDDFIIRQVAEAYVVILPWHLRSAGFVAGLDLPGVAMEFTRLTGRPFPAPPPQPTPEPQPEPVPIPGPQLGFPLAAVQPWLERPRSWKRAIPAAAAIRAWLDEH